MVYPVTNTGAQSTISADAKWIHSLGIPQSIVHDRGTAFNKTDFINWTNELGITLPTGATHWPWTNGEIETKNQHIARFWWKFLKDAGNNWSSLVTKLVFAITMNVSTIQLERHPTKKFLGQNPKSPCL